jgi:hypothetical protein
VYLFSFYFFMLDVCLFLDLVRSYDAITSASDQARTLFLALEDVLERRAVEVDRLHRILAYMDANEGRDHFQASFEDDDSVDEVFAALEGLIPTVHDFKKQWRFGSDAPIVSSSGVLPPTVVDADAEGEEASSSEDDEKAAGKKAKDFVSGDIPMTGLEGPLDNNPVLAST